MQGPAVYDGGVRGPRLVFPLVWALVACSGCGGSEGRRHPTFVEGFAPRPTLVMRTLACLEAVEVASGGLRIRRATRFGEDAVRRLDERVGRLGPSIPSLPRSQCAEMASAEAIGAGFNHPAPPPGLGEILAAARARSLLVPVVSSRVRCDRSAARWRWGEPAYSDPAGEIDCHESEISMRAFLYASDGTLLWKNVRTLTAEGAPDATEAAAELIDRAPLSAGSPPR